MLRAIIRCLHRIRPRPCILAQEVTMKPIYEDIFCGWGVVGDESHYIKCHSTYHVWTIQTVLYQCRAIWTEALNCKFLHNAVNMYSAARAPYHQ